MKVEPLILELLQFLDIQGSISDSKLFTCRSDFLHLFAWYFFWWNGDHGLKCGHYVPTIFILV